MSQSLTIALRAEPARDGHDEPARLRAVFTNTSDRALALTFWWTRRLRVVDAQGREVAPGPGPVLPCGVAEDWTVLAPGERHEHNEPLACTQPAGRSEPIGWSYALAPGTYRVRLFHEAPPAHGFTQSAPHPDAFRGRVESDEVTITVAAPPERPGLLRRLFG